MKNIEKLIQKAITSDTVNKTEIAELLAKGLSKDSCAYMELYDTLYGNTLCKEECESWVESMSGGNEVGQKWSVEEIAEIGNRIGVDFDKVTKYELWASTHYEYYTHKDTLKKSGIPSDGVLYVHFGYDFVCANDDDLKTFYFNVVCKD